MIINTEITLVSQHHAIVDESVEDNDNNQTCWIQAKHEFTLSSPLNEHL
jgi:hypothetical protein